MKALILPIILLIAGTGAGVGAGLVLGGSDDDAEPAGADLIDGALPPCGDAEQEHAEEPISDDHDGPTEDGEFVRLNNQFIVPVVEQEEVGALVVLSISLEVAPGATEEVFSREPRLRDQFLQVLFDHANIGGFSGNFTSASNMQILRSGLRQAAKATLGDRVVDVLIIDIVRQDVQD
ncbi:flagellar basal body-associated FliL family protein [Pelagovum pacificum]|uniref:Flagellar protein FliL n=1 Tax=Pelagovum pacificum TaxID=2588711 RepID=A0A5C5GGK3_9RHOB|nr:flagellar basal body-associated FliL family protein [Pelagovum pacificum]QQA42977.1 flagellar basal body-associated FliL family protein [Pelagovum pacificum]TNY33878.1 flagellar basal body-associated FliL family protein [Pelagovum pacificum]